MNIICLTKEGKLVASRSGGNDLREVMMAALN